MTLQELSGFYRLQQKIQQNLETLESLESRVHPGAQALTGMPHGSGTSDRVGELAIEIAELKTGIERLTAKAKVEREKLDSFINDIEDVHIQLICRLRFIRCLTWGEVAAVIGGHNTEHGVKVCFYRFLRAQKQSN